MIELLKQIPVGTLPSWGSVVILGILAWKFSSKNGANPMLSTLKSIDESSKTIAKGTQYLVERERKRERIEEIQEARGE